MNLLLAINLSKVQSAHWAATYQTIKRIIDAFPVEPMCLLETQYSGEKHYVWTKNIIRNKGKNEEHIDIKGDWASYERGGSFTLFKELGTQQTESAKSKDIFCDKDLDDKSHDKSSDVLWLPEDHEYINQVHVNANFAIWDNGTQGAPYALLLLAIGIFLENEMGENAFFHGEFNEVQAGKMLSWLNDVLSSNYTLPIAFDAEQLWNRLKKAYPAKPAPAVERFRSFSLLPVAEQISFLQKVQPKNVERHIIEHIKSYNSVAQWGVLDYILPYLEATQDVENLIKIIQETYKINQEKDFSLLELLTEICSKSITVNPAERYPIHQWNDKGEHLVGSMETFNRIFMKMGGLPNTLKYYIHPDELLETFAYYEPKNGSKFKKIIDKEHKNCLKNIKKLEKASDALIEENDYIENTFELDDSLLHRSFHQNEDFILQQVVLQQRKFNFEEDYMDALGSDLLGMIKRHDNKYPSRPLAHDLQTRQDYIKAILALTTKRDFAIRDTAIAQWEKIENIQILKMLFAYCNVNEREINFFRIRIYVLENPSCYLSWARLLKI